LIIRKWPRRPSSVIAGARGDAVKIERELLLCNPLICRVSSAVEQRFCNSATAVPLSASECQAVRHFGPNLAFRCARRLSPYRAVSDSWVAKG
jgi:hypothetical protein